MRGVFAQTRGKGGDPGLLDRSRQGNRHQKADRPRALGGEIGEIHAQHLAADFFGRIVGKKMHAGDDAVGGQHQIAAGRRRHDGGVVAKTERARRRGERTEIARDQALLR